MFLPTVNQIQESCLQESLSTLCFFNYVLTKHLPDNLIQNIFDLYHFMKQGNLGLKALFRGPTVVTWWCRKSNPQQTHFRLSGQRHNHSATTSRHQNHIFYTQAQQKNAAMPQCPVLFNWPICAVKNAAHCLCSSFFHSLFHVVFIFTVVPCFPLDSLYWQSPKIAKCICCVHLFGVFGLKNKSVKKVSCHFCTCSCICFCTMCHIQNSRPTSGCSLEPMSIN